MTFVADENFPRPAVEALRNTGWEVFSVAEECPGISDEEVAALYSANDRVRLTFDKDFGELVFRRGLPARSGIVLFRLTPESPEDVKEAVLPSLECYPISTARSVFSLET